MSDYVRYFRAPGNIPVRVKVESDQGVVSPRQSDDNWAALVTWERDYHSPDKRNELPAELGEAVYRWATPDSVDAYRVARYAGMFHAGSVVFVGGLTRNGYDAEISLDVEPSRNGVRWVGLAVVTRDAWEQAMGPGYRGEVTPAELAQQEVQRYSAWAAGDCHGYVVERPAFRGASIDCDPEVIDSCGGYIGEPDYALLQGVANVPDGSVEITEAEFDELMDRAREHAGQKLAW